MTLSNNERQLVSTEPGEVKSKLESLSIGDEIEVVYPNNGIAKVEILKNKVVRFRLSPEGAAADGAVYCREVRVTIGGESEEGYLSWSPEGFYLIHYEKRKR